jgi:dihydrofolate reductase
MGKIVISENISLDGVVEDPAGTEGFKHGGWVGHVNNREAVGKAVLDDALEAEAQLYGRRTYEFLAARWPGRDGVLADRLNAMPKYVVSSTLEDLEWNNTTVLNGDAMEEVSKLRQELDGDIIVAGSIRLARALIENDLADELRLAVYPVVLGSGERLFVDTEDAKDVNLIDAHAGDGVSFLTYDVVRDA